MLKIETQNWFTKDKEWSSKWGQFHISWSSDDVESLCNADKPSKTVWWLLRKMKFEFANFGKNLDLLPLK